MMLASIKMIKTMNARQEMIMPPIKVFNISEKIEISVIIATKRATITKEKDIIASILFAFMLFILLQIM